MSECFVTVIFDDSGQGTCNKLVCKGTVDGRNCGPDCTAGSAYPVCELNAVAASEPWVKD